jgi:hypothetical protein
MQPKILRGLTGEMHAAQDVDLIQARIGLIHVQHCHCTVHTHCHHSLMQCTYITMNFTKKKFKFKLEAKKYKNILSHLFMRDVELHALANATKRLI